MRKIQYSWVVCAVCTLLLFCTVGLPSSAFSVYQPYIIAVNNFTNAQAASIITVRSIAAVLTTFCMDCVIRRLGSRLCALIAPLGIAMGFAIFAFSKSYQVYLVGAVVIGVAYAMGGMMLASIIIAHWFYSKRAFAYSICTAGTGLAMIVAPPIVTVLIERFSLHTAFLFEAGFIAVAALIIGLFVRNDPKELGMSPYGMCGASEKRVYREAKVPGRILFAASVGSMLIGAITNYNSTHVATLFHTNGFAPLQVSAIVSVHGLTLTAFKFLYGYYVDWNGGEKANLLFSMLGMIGHAVLFVAALIGNFSLACIGMAFTGCGLPLGTVGVTVVATELSTREGFTRNLKFVQAMYSVGALVYSIIPGIIADLTGSYNPTIVVTFLMMGTYGLLMSFVFRKTRHG